tara:strand:+ start:475 stop:780 length:306 start_codon:yes stop_codon:yes gene_type:complete
VTDKFITDVEAEETTKQYWDQAHPKPMGSVKMVQAIVKRALIAGYSELAIIDALNKCKAFTVNAVEYQLRASYVPPEAEKVQPKTVEWVENSDGTVTRMVS